MSDENLSHLSAYDRRVADWSWWRKLTTNYLVAAPGLRLAVHDFGGEIVRGEGWKAYWIGDTSISTRMFRENVGRVFREVAESVYADFGLKRRRLGLIRIVVVSPRLRLSDVLRSMMLSPVYRSYSNNIGYVWEWRTAVVQVQPASSAFLCSIAVALITAFCHLLMDSRDQSTWSVAGYSHVIARRYQDKMASEPVSFDFGHLAEARTHGFEWTLEHVLRADAADMTELQARWFTWLAGCFVHFLRAESERYPSIWQFFLRSMSSDLPIKVSDVERVERVFSQPLAEIEAHFNAYCEQQAREYRESHPTPGDDDA